MLLSDSYNMAFRNLLAEMKDITVVDRPVNVDLEVSRLLAQDVTAPILFKDINGMRAAGNIWSTRDRIAAALKISKEELMSKMLEALSSPSTDRLTAPFLEDEGEFI